MNPTLSVFLSGLTVLLLSYLCGSVPWGYLIGRFNGIDIREYGSHNIGATNVRRVLGRDWSIICFLLDFFKGLLPVLIIGQRWAGGWAIGTQWGMLLAAAGAVLGHVFTCWLRFRGGKGVATSLGVALGLAWLPVLIGGLAWLLFFQRTRVVAIASMAAVVTMAIAALVLWLGGWGCTWHVAVLMVALALIVVLRHADNIKRLREGTENVFSKICGKKEESAEKEEK